MPCHSVNVDGVLLLLGGDEDISALPLPPSPPPWERVLDQRPVIRGTPLTPVDRHTPVKTAPSPSFGRGR